MSNPLYVKKLLLATFAWISDVYVFTGDYTVFYVLRGRNNRISEEQKKLALGLIEPHRIAGMQVEVVTRLPIPRGVTHQFVVPANLEQIVEASNPTRQGILDAVNKAFPEANFFEIVEDFGARKFTLYQEFGAMAICPTDAGAVVHLINPGVPWRVNVEFANRLTNRPVSKHALELSSSRSIGNYSLRRLSEQDEVFLSKHYSAGLTGSLHFNDPGASVFVDSYPGERQAIRPLLAVFDKVIITPRVGDNATFDLTDDEILAALEAGRLNIACKRDLSFYKDPLLAKAIETDISAVLGPRQLGLYMAAEQIRRNPLLSELAINFDDTRVFLDILKNAISQSSLDHPHLYNLLIDDTISNFANISRGVAIGGPSFALSNGYGNLAAKLYALANPHVNTPDIELWGVGESMQAGLALNSYILRSHGAFYHPHYEFISKLISAKPQDLSTLAEIDTTLEGLYIPTLDGMPISDYLKIFNTEMNQKVRSLLLDILRKSNSPSELKSRVARLKLESSLVRGSRSNRAKLDVLGFGLSFISFQASWMGWLAQRGIAASGPIIEKKFAAVAEKRERLEAKILDTSVQAVQLADIQSSVDEQHVKTARHLFGRMFRRANG